MIFIDASAFVAIIAKEPDHIPLARRLNSDPSIACSAISIWETIAALVRTHRDSVSAARTAAGNYVRDLGFQYVQLAHLRRSSPSRPSKHTAKGAIRPG